MNENAKIEWGCVAVGCSGKADVAVNESLSGPERWEMSIELPPCSLRFSVLSTSVVIQLCEFLRLHRNSDTTGELALGSVGMANVLMISDDEFIDRFFLCAFADDGAVRFTLTGQDVADLIIALEQAIADLKE